jgi:UDP-3-O-[3-hydroxymyristoyl] glucosamine N-acyltransferase
VCVPVCRRAVAGNECQIQSGTRVGPPVFVTRVRTSHDSKGVPALPMPSLSHAP